MCRQLPSYLYIQFHQGVNKDTPIPKEEGKRGKEKGVGVANKAAI